MTLTEQQTTSLPNYWQGVLVLAGKDLVDAFKNRTILTILLGLSFVVLSGQALPLLLRLDDRPRVVIYDPARTRAADLLRREGVVQVGELRRAADLQNAARDTSGLLLSIALPDAWPESSGPLAVDGYVVHWIKPEAAAAAAAEAEAALAEVTGRPVDITLQTVYPTAETGGHTVMIALGFVIVVIMITSIVVPYLILEEKTGHTLQVLRVSPVSEGQIVLGKGLAGIAFGLLAAAVLLVFNFRLVRFWDVMFLAMLLGSLFGVGLGLLVGALVEDEGGVQLWLGLVSVLLLAPLMTIFVDPGRLPNWLAEGLQWLPTLALFDLVRLAFYENRLPAEILTNGSLVLASALLLFGLVTWRLRRWEAR